MKRTFKVIATIAIIVLLMFILTGCTTSMSYTFKVETGDTIKIKLDTTNGHSINSELPFKITKDGKTLSQGMFINMNGYDQYITGVNNSNSVKIIDKGTKNGVEYTFYSYNNTEYNYIIKISGSNTGVLLGNNQSQEIAEECFKLLTFSKE